MCESLFSKSQLGITEIPEHMMSSICWVQITIYSGSSQQYDSGRPGRRGIHESVYSSGTRHRHQSTENGKASGLDDIQTELIKQFLTKARDCLLRFFQQLYRDLNKFRSSCNMLRYSDTTEARKGLSVAKSVRPISLLCHTYKLFERHILNRIAEHVDAKLIPEQAGFRPGKS